MKIIQEYLYAYMWNCVSKCNGESVVDMNVFIVQVFRDNMKYWHVENNSLTIQYETLKGYEVRIESVFVGSATNKNFYRLVRHLLKCELTLKFLRRNPFINFPLLGI